MKNKNDDAFDTSYVDATFRFPRMLRVMNQVSYLPEILRS